MMYAPPLRHSSSRKTTNLLREEHHPSWHKRHPADEDDNKFIAKKVKRQNRQILIRHFFNKCLVLTNPLTIPPVTLAIPKRRPFKWMISSHHVAEEYQNKGLRDQSPWRLLIRCLLIDLPEQLENGIDIKSWREHLVGDLEAVTFMTRPSTVSNYPNLKWGRRIVFSEQTKDEPRFFTGHWLVVAYLWSDNHEWLGNIDVRSLVSFGSAFW